MKLKLSASLMLILALSACGSMRQYQAESQGAIDFARAGKPDSALAVLESNNSDKDLLYYLEKGQLLQFKNDWSSSSSAWLKADAKIHDWEETAKNSPDKLFGEMGSFLINDKTRRYDGYDYEKVLLSTLLAVNHAASGDWGNARVEVRKTHEREAIIAEFRSRAYEKDEAEAKNRGVKTTFKDLKGYPTETLDDPDVLALKNSYQNAFSHYFAAFVYEALGEKSLAAPGYRKAIELQPNTKVLEDGLSQLDSKTSKRGMTEVLFVVSSGLAPVRKSVTVPLPIYRVGLTAMSFPVIRSGNDFAPSQLKIDGRFVPVSTIASVDAMSRRALRDDMPGIILRSTIRAVSKGVAQKQLNDRDNNASAIASLVLGLVSVITEQADERTWSTLPAQIAIVRASLPQGMHKILVPTLQGQEAFDFKASSPYQIVPIRVMGNQVYFGQTDLAPVVLDTVVTDSADAMIQPAKPKKAKK
ncbi:MAG: hypothetical protein NT086_03850 [Proteobacteria bacterium]|nr:hypothetical protein [Pseudomonadota bacterium]